MAEPARADPHGRRIAHPRGSALHQRGGSSLFTMFAEDVELIPKASFTKLLESLRDTPAGFVPKVEALWRE